MSKFAYANIKHTSEAVKSAAAAKAEFDAIQPIAFGRTNGPRKSFGGFEFRFVHGYEAQIYPEADESAPSDQN